MPKLDDSYKKIVVIGDDNNLYEVTEDVWKKKPLTDPLTAKTVNVLKAAGSYLAFMRPDLAVGAGMACTVVNLKAILKNNPIPKKAPKKRAVR